MLYPTNFVPDKEISDIIAEIDKFKDFWNSHIDELQKVLPDAATVRGMGEFRPVITPPTDDVLMENVFSQVEKSLHSAKDNAAYDNLLNTVFEQYGHLELSEENIKQMHRILFRHTGNNQSIGRYKVISNKPYIMYDDGHIYGALFNPAPPIRVPRLMREVVAWTEEQLKQNIIHPIIVIGIFKLHFVNIHPFTDGNGRISRALINLLMMKSGYSYMPYASIDTIIKISRIAYHRGVITAEHQRQYLPWLKFFVLVLQEQKRCLEKIINETGCIEQFC